MRLEVGREGGQIAGEGGNLRGQGEELVEGLEKIGMVMLGDIIDFLRIVCGRKI